MNESRPHDEPAFSGVFSGTFLSVVLLSLLGVAGVRTLRGAGLSFGSTAEPRTVSPREDLPPDELATVRLFEAASRSVVQIQASNLRRPSRERQAQEVPEGSGSGVVWDERGHVVTNLHVVQDATVFRVRFQDGSPYPARVVGTARDYDLAVLEVDAPREKLAPLPLGRSAELRVGQRTFAIGYPFGLEQTLTAGIVSGLDRMIQSQSGLAIHGVIQTDAAINPGNSGGPLLDSAGRLVGINTAIATATNANSGVSFAVPADTINRIVPRILEEGSIERAGLGIYIAQDLYAADEGLRGAVILEALEGGPAAKAGLQGMRLPESGTPEVRDVIVSIDGKAITREADLYQALEVYRAGEEIRVGVSRPGRTGRRVEEIPVRLVPLR